MYCGSCGTELNLGARFCRSCGSAQAAAAPSLPPPPPPFPPPGALQVGRSAPPPVVAAGLAILGGIGLCFLALYATVYRPLHYDYPVNFGEPIHFGDVLALLSGAAAIAIGILLLTRPGNRNVRAALLVVAGLPTLLFALMWTFADTFHLDWYSNPFYFGYVYFAEFGQAQIGSRYVQALLVASCLMVVGAGLIAALFPSRQSAAAVR